MQSLPSKQTVQIEVERWSLPEGCLQKKNFFELIYYLHDCVENNIVGDIRKN